MRNRLLCGLLIALLSARAASAAILYVDGGHCPSGDGTSWATAYCTIQEAINAGATGDGVFVKKGTYAEIITMRSGIFVFGGFAGIESLPEQRDIAANDTIINVSTLSGVVAVEMGNLENTRLDGFVITGGNVNGGVIGILGQELSNTCSIGNCRIEGFDGGGVSLFHAPITIDNCSFIRNFGSNFGGGVGVTSSDGFRITGSLFDGNWGAAFGGGLYVGGSTVSIEGCNFISNSATTGGGICARDNSSVSIKGSSFFNNSAQSGGAIQISNQTFVPEPVVLDHCIIEYSSTVDDGSVEFEGTDSQVLDCLISRNGTPGLFLKSGHHNVSQCTIANNYVGLRAVSGASVTLDNTIFAGSSRSAIGTDGSSVIPGNCLFFENANDFFVDGGLFFNGASSVNANVVGAVANLTGDPAFRNAAAQDFHLLATSAAIGAANAIYATATDLDGVQRPTVQGQIDLGAYQFSDLVGPSVLSIARADASPTNAGIVHFNVVFDEAVQGVGANDFQVVSNDAKAAVGASVTSVTGANDRWVVTVNTGTGDGTLRLDLIDNDSILDFSNNLLGGPGNGNGSFTTGEEYVLDKTVPVITLKGLDLQSLEAGSFYSEPGYTAADNLDGDITDRVQVAGFVNVGQLGIYTISYSVRDTAGNVSDPVSRTITIQDTKAPLITLLGANPVTVPFGTAYADPGATAYDLIDGDVTSSITFSQPSDTSEPGSYLFVFHAHDNSGNYSTATRIVNVVDDTPPIITLNGSARVEVKLGDAYSDAGATAVDNVDGDLTAQIVVTGSLTTAVPGEYTITYTVSDLAGNETVATRTVVVLDLPDFYVTPQIQFISSFARTVAFDVYNRSTAGQSWTATVTEGTSWCHITAGATGDQFYGQIYVQSDDNPTANRRVAKIQVANADKFALPIIVEVSQAPTPKGILGCGGEGAPSNGPAGDVAVVVLLASALVLGRATRAKAN